MSTELPAGIDESDVRMHAISLSIVGTMINLTGTYLSAEDGSPEESEAETALDDFLERVLEMGPAVVGRAMITFATALTATAEQETVQAWFDDQGSRISPFLTPEERGE